MRAPAEGKPDWVLRILVALFALCILAMITGMIGQLVMYGTIRTP